MQRSSAATWRSRALASAVALFVGLATLLVPSAAQAATYNGQLNPGQTLYPNDTLRSPNGQYHLVQQGDGNLVMRQMPGGKPLWSNGQAGKNGTETRMQGDGNVVSVHVGVPVWTTHTQNNWNSTLHMQDDANLVVRKPGNVPIWSTGGQSVGNCSDGDRNRSLHYANNGLWRNPVAAVYWSETYYFNTAPFQKTYNFKLEVRYNDGDRCAYALLTGAGPGDRVYLDRSTNGGGSWSGWLNNTAVNAGNTSAYTGVLRDGKGFWLRACSPRPNNQYRCTDWH